MKKFVTLAATVAVAALLAGCAGKDAGGGDAPQAPTLTLKLGFVDTSGSLVDQAAHHFKEAVEEGTDGALKVDIYGNGQLGAETEMVESMALGALDIAVVGDSMVANFIPEYSGISMPYLVDGLDHLKRIAASDIADDISEAFSDEVGASVLGWWYRQPRNLTTNFEVDSVDDIAGLKVRVSNPTSQAAWAGMGANPTAVPFTELFVSLQQGVVDAQENPVDLIKASKFNEVQSHLILTEHLLAPYLILFNDTTLAKLSDEQRAVVVDAVADAEVFLDELVAKTQAEDIAFLKQAGMTVIVPDVESFRSALDASGTVDRLAKDWAPGLVDRIRELGDR